MDRQSFTSHAPGELVEASDPRGNRGPAFVPAMLPPSIETSLGDRELRLALSKAAHELSNLNGMARQIDRPELLLEGYLRNEAVLSSAIEGTHTSLADLALFEASHLQRSKDDAHVSNYVEAFKYGRERVADLRIGRTIFGELHQILMRAADPAKTNPGRFRDRVVFVGHPTFEGARFVPPPETFVPELLDDLERYLEHDEEAPLIKIAIAHYQFETIHPYLDGNGRIGRLLISLWLQRAGILTSPMLYLSAYFERHRQAYYDALLNVSTRGEWREWILFFLRGVAIQSRDAARRTDALVALREEYKRRVAGKRVSQGVARLIDELFRFPVLSVPSAMTVLGVTKKSARETLQRLIGAGILDPKPVKIRNTHFFLAGELIDLTTKPLDEVAQTLT